MGAILLFLALLGVTFHQGLVATAAGTGASGAQPPAAQRAAATADPRLSLAETSSIQVDAAGRVLSSSSSSGAIAPPPHTTPHPLRLP